MAFEFSEMKSMKISVGIHSVEVLSKVPNYLCCILCSNILSKPFQAPCGCRFCYDCIRDYLKDKDCLCPGNTEDCQVKLNIDRNLQPDNLAKREISKITVKCPLSLCEEQLELAVMQDHITACGSSMVSCNACSVQMTRGEYDAHLRNECKESIVNCGSCKIAMKRVYLQEQHLNYDHENLCSSFSDFCPNQCGEVDKVVWANHKVVCTRTNVLCPYNVIGCSSNGTTMRAMTKHMSDNGFCHGELLLKHIDNLNNEISCLNVSLTKLTEENARLAKQNDGEQRYDKQIIAINAKVRELERGALRNKHQNQALIKEEVAAALRSHNNSLDRMNEGVTKLRFELNEIKTRNGNNLENDDTDKKIPKFPINHIVSKNVVLVWMVPEFRQIHNSVSPVFYSHAKGYKMYLSLEKKIKGHLSMYAQLMSGEYDDDLAFPFRRCVSIILVDQEHQGRDCVKRVLFNDKAGNFCNRKYSNVPSDFGYPRFITYDDLNQMTYLVKGNKLLVHCSVDELQAS